MVLTLTCSTCGYTWAYSGAGEFYATCPKCLRKVKIKSPPRRRKSRRRN